MYIIKMDKYFLETRRSVKNSVHSRESVSGAQDILVSRQELASKYTLHFAQYLAEKYKDFKPTIVKAA